MGTNPLPEVAPSPIAPYWINVGGGDSVLSGIQQFDFDEIAIASAERDRKAQEEQQAKAQAMVKAGLVSALDLGASTKAMLEFDKAVKALKQQHTIEAVNYLQKAITDYPKFVSAHNNLGTGYLELGDNAHARAEFETATKLDDKFPASFLNLAHLSLSEQNFSDAEKNLEKVVSLKPRDPEALTALVYVQNAVHNYHHAIETAERVHGLDHKNFANAHYFAASAAVSLHDYAVAEREFKFFVQEDPHNPFAPTAEQNLEVLAKYKNGAPQTPSGGGAQQPGGMIGGQQVQTFPDSEHLRSELAALGKEGDEECHDCAVTPAGPVVLAPPESRASPSSATNLTIRKVVDEVAVYFTATKSGQYVNDLQLIDLELRDDGKPAAKIQQFAPQAKLPMRLALVIDTSGSVEQRFSFEKKAAERFLSGMVTNPADLALVMGFSNQHNVTQEFTSNLDQLAAGVETLTNGGGTALFDAVLFACQKLSAYPDKERVARVVVVLSDGEDNSSKVSLRSVIQVANASGITIYAISTKEAKGKDGDWGQPTTTADHILEALTERTGGEALFPAEINLLGRRFDKLHDIIRNRYLIAYRPADFEADGHYRRISIKAVKDGKPLAIRARQGYYAQIEGSASIPDPK
jgi:VWFA-related protein